MLSVCRLVPVLIGVLLLGSVGFPHNAEAQRRPPGTPPPGSRTSDARTPPPGAPSGLRALTPPVEERDVQVLATFEDARRVAVAPNALLYVADGRRSTVTAVTPDGRVVATLGGRGTEAGAFDEPVDVDPTNGLEIYVADAGNGRIQHFSRNGKYVEALPVGRVDPGPRTPARQPLFDAGRDGSDARADGRPIAVAAAPNGDIFVLDARENLVVRYDRQRRAEPFAGGFDARDGALVDPFAMTLADGNIVVADAGRAQLLTFDRFGTLDRARPLPPGPAVRSLRAVRDQLWLVTPSQIVVVDARTGRAVGALPTSLNEPLVDAARINGTLVLLTPTRLVLAPRVRLPR